MRIAERVSAGSNIDDLMMIFNTQRDDTHDDVQLTSDHYSSSPAATHDQATPSYTVRGPFLQVSRMLR